MSRSGLALAERLEERVAARAAQWSTPGPVRLSVVFLQWDAARGATAFAALDRRLSDLQGVQVRRLVVDNAAVDGSVHQRPDGVVVVPGDNAAREFSGWQRGIEVGRVTGAEADVWLLVNDRYDTSPYRFAERLSAGAVRTACALQAVVGRVDGYPHAVRSFGLDVSSWVNTAFYLVPDAVLRRLGGPVLVGPGDLDAVMPAEWPTAGPLFRADGPVGELHGRYLVAFLGHAGDAPHGAHWYRRLEASEATWGEFRAKVMSILNEQLFSAVARQAGVPLVEMALAGRLGAMGIDTPTVRSALDRLAQWPAEESVRLQRVATRLGMAMTALASPPARARRVASTVGAHQDRRWR